MINRLLVIMASTSCSEVGFPVRTRFIGAPWWYDCQDCRFASHINRIGHVRIESEMLVNKYLESVVILLRQEFLCDVDWNRYGNIVSFYSATRRLESLEACIEAFPTFIPDTRFDLLKTKI